MNFLSEIIQELIEFTHYIIYDIVGFDYYFMKIFLHELINNLRLEIRLKGLYVFNFYNFAMIRPMHLKFINRKKDFRLYFALRVDTYTIDLIHLCDKILILKDIFY